MVCGNKNTSEYYAPHEIQDILEAMDSVQIARLCAVYGASGCEQRAAMTCEDVFNQVVLGALTTRRWKKENSVEVFFRMTGKSIIENESNKRANQGILPSTGNVDDTQRTETNNTAGLRVPSLQLIDHDKIANFVEVWTNKVLNLFYDDEDALCYLRSKLEEFKKSVIIQRCNFTDKSYRNVEKRIKNKVRKRHPNGIPWWEIEL